MVVGFLKQEKGVFCIHFIRVLGQPDAMADIAVIFQSQDQIRPLVCRHLLRTKTVGGGVPCAGVGLSVIGHIRNDRVALDRIGHQAQMRRDALRISQIDERISRGYIGIPTERLLIRTAFNLPYLGGRQRFAEQQQGVRRFVQLG